MTSSPTTAATTPTQPITWESIAMKFVSELSTSVAPGLAAGIVTGLISKWFGPDAMSPVRMRQLFQEFADDIVNRVTANVRTIIKTELIHEEVRRISVSATAMGDNYDLYQSSGKTEYLLAAEQGAISTTAAAESLGIHGLGIFLVTATAKVAIFLEKGMKPEAIREIDRVLTYTNRLQEQALSDAESAVGEPRYVGPYGFPQKRLGVSYMINVNGQDRLEIATGTRSTVQIREEIVAELKGIVTNNLVDPTRAILAMWDAMRLRLESS